MTELGLLAGFDAGQTHTTCRLVDAGSGAPWAEGQGPGVTHLAAAQGGQHFREALQGSLQAAYNQHRLMGLDGAGDLDAAGRAQPRLLAAGIGASGIETDTNVPCPGLSLAAEALGLSPGRVALTGDGRTALRGAMGQAEAGILVISGTGTIAVGRNSTGLEHRCAGWGWLVDGAGSAMDLGRDGLALSLHMADGRLADGPLRHQIWQALGLEPHDPGAAQAIKSLVVDPNFGSAGFARLAPVVAHLAEAGDGHAQAIVERSAQALALMAAAISRILELEAPLVWPQGGALLHLQPLRTAFGAALTTACPGAQLATAAGDACDGALSLARERLKPR